MARKSNSKKALAGVSIEQTIDTLDQYSSNMRDIKPITPAQVEAYEQWNKTPCYCSFCCSYA